MLSLHLESRILGLAQAEGLLRDDPEGTTQVRSLLDPDAVAHASLWGPRIDGLVREGKLSQDRVESFAWRLTSATGAEDIGSWMDAELLPDLPDLEGCEVAGRYDRLSYLGEGALGRVYKAYDRVLQRWVALKFLKVALPGKDSALLKEARAQAQVEHPHVCRIYEVGEMEGRAFIAMQWVEGTNLSQALQNLSLREKVRVVRDLAHGVHAAHQKGLLHLDIKPGNALVQTLADGSLHPFLTDFGMVSTEIPSFGGRCPMGTPPFSSPEQISGKADQLCPQSDVYALGATLFVMVTGALPFQADSFGALLEAIQVQPPIAMQAYVPDAPPALEAIVARSLAKAPSARYPSAQALAEALDAFLRGSEQPASFSVGKALLVGLPVVALFGFLGLRYLPEPKQPTPASPIQETVQQDLKSLLAQITAKEASYRDEIAVLAERMKKARTESERREIEREAERIKVQREAELAELRRKAERIQGINPTDSAPRNSRKEETPAVGPKPLSKPEVEPASKPAVPLAAPFIVSRKEPLGSQPVAPPPEPAPTTVAPSVTPPPVAMVSASRSSLLKAQLPELAPAAREAFQGTQVRFTVLVDEVGSPRTIRPLACPEGLTAAFTRAIQRSTFRPELLDGQPIRRWVTLSYLIRSEGIQVE